MSNKITLIFTPLRFYTNQDEDLFFAWIDTLQCLENYEGIGRELHVHLKSKDISFIDHTNLIGLFERYKLSNPEQLKIFNVIDWTESKRLGLKWPITY